MFFQKWVWESFLECINKNDMKVVIRIIGIDEFYLLQCLVLEEWMFFQEIVVYKCIGICGNESIFYFFLRMNLYVYFILLIRRYFDLIINRLIYVVLEKRKCLYLFEEVYDFCGRFNSMMCRVRKF